MNTDDNCGLAMFKWLAMLLSFAIALPGYFDDNSKIAFILTSCVIIFGKFIDNIEGIIRYRIIFHTFFCIIGSAIGAIAIGFCFYYFAAISNVTQIVEISKMETNAEVYVENVLEDDVDVEDVSIQLVSDKDMSKYPLFEGEFFYGFLFLVLIYQIIQDTIFCGCEFCKYINTKRRILLSMKKSNKLLDISVE